MNPSVHYVYDRAPRNVYWEITSACDLACQHCRAQATPNPAFDELTTNEGKALLDDVATLGSMLVFTGGDPLKRPDLFELIEYGRALRIPTAVTPSTTPRLTRDVIERFRSLGVSALGVSLDGPGANVHDGFRGVEGTFQRALQALDWARELKVPVQINTTVCAETASYLEPLYRLLLHYARAPVVRWSLFLLVQTGRGHVLRSLDARCVESLFDWVYETAQVAPFHISTVEAPHYRRFWLEKKRAEGVSHEEITRLARSMGFGVRDGNGVVFVASNGDVFPAGFLPTPRLGNVRNQQLSNIYRGSPALRVLRDMDGLSGKCGLCEHRWICGGSRARAYAANGNMLAEEPLCAYVPKATAS